MRIESSREVPGRPTTEPDGRQTPRTGQRLRLLAGLLWLAPLVGCAPSTAPTAETSQDAPAQSLAPSGTPAAEQAATGDDGCADGSAAEWSDCVGQGFEVRGHVPAMLGQHPMLVSPALPGSDAPTQSYIETADGVQVIVLSQDSRGDCSGALRVSGILQSIELGGSEGSKLSYRGWALQEATIACAEAPKPD